MIMRSHIVWGCVSVGTCAAGFLAQAIPVLQLLALVISIAAGLKALLGKKKA